ncbi:MAG: hypothetical protein E7599_06820, partial [Ruminococcaceae bacterium]|nr:hypothetical protein [Oscillospiraceae bacterium]
MQANQNRVFRRCLLLLSALAGILIAALILFACADGRAKDSEANAPSESESDPGATLTCALSDYTIVRGDSSGNPVLKQALNLRSAVRSKANIDLPLSTDFTPDEGAPEILIGMTNRKESIELAGALTESTKFILKAVGNKIVILAGTQKGLAEAVTYLTNEYLSGAAKATDVSQIDHTEPLEDVVLLNKSRSLQFVLPDNTSEQFAVCAESILASFEIPGLHLVTRSHFTADHAICIGNVPQDAVSVSYADIVGENEYVAGPDTVLLLDLNQPHRYEALGDIWEHEWVNFSGGCCAVYHDMINADGLRILPLNGNETIPELLHAISEWTTHHDALSHVHTATEIIRLLDALCALAVEQQRMR